MQALVLAGGLATRMLPRTADTPKYLLTVAGRPFAAWQLEQLARAGIDDVVLCVAHLGDRIRDFCGDGARFGLRVRYVDDGEIPLGTGGPLVKARDAGILAREFLVLYGDSYLRFDHAGPLRQLAQDDTLDGVMAVFRNAGRWDASNVLLSADGLRVARYEKGSTDPSLDHIDYGATALRARVLDGQVSGVPFGLDELQRRLAAAGHLGAHIASERFHEIGSAGGLADLSAHLEADLPPGDPGRRSST